MSAVLPLARQTRTPAVIYHRYTPTTTAQRNKRMHVALAELDRSLRRIERAASNAQHAPTARAAKPAHHRADHDARKPAPSSTPHRR